MTVQCECGSRTLRVTSATEQTDADGNVTEWIEIQCCGECGREGRLEHENGKDRLHGCLTQSGGVW